MFVAYTQSYSSQPKSILHHQKLAFSFSPFTMFTQMFSMDDGSNFQSLKNK